MAHTAVSLKNSRRIDEEGRNAPGEKFQEVLTRRFSRRALLGRALALAPALVVVPVLGERVFAATAASANAQGAAHGLTFTPIDLDTSDALIVPAGYAAKVLIRWGDPLFPGVPIMDLNAQSSALQMQQFGYNNDYIGLFALPHHRSQTPGHAIMAVNHEWTWGRMMVPGFNGFLNYTQDQVDIDMAAHGMTMVEIERIDNDWSYRVDSPFNRRITAFTPCELTGPAAGSEYLRTSDDPAGRRVLGTFQGCGGGVTPYGTFLSAEEGWMNYFGNLDGLPSSDPRKANHRAYGIFPKASERGWERFYDRFDVAAEPNEPFRFGWVVEVDPYDPGSVPKKRTALGRLKRECAEPALGKDGRLALYMAEDQAFQCMYKFVTAGQVNVHSREANADLLDDGTLYVARFNDDGTGEWLPLVGGEGALAEWTHVEVLVNTRAAAAKVGGTKMDKPEGFRPSPVTGKVYCNLTNNPARGAVGQPPPDAANPRAKNVNGHVLELVETGDDHSATTFTWEVFIQCGNPDVAADHTYFAGFDPSQVSAISNPDYLTFDNQGNLWLATDGLSKGLIGNDGIFAVPVEGEDRGHLRQFMSGPVDSELTGPRFNRDSSALFVSVQHPGRNGSLAAPTSVWPDGDVAKPAVVVVTKTRGRSTIGS